MSTTNGTGLPELNELQAEALRQEMAQHKEDRRLDRVTAHLDYLPWGVKYTLYREDQAERIAAGTISKGGTVRPDVLVVAA